MRVDRIMFHAYSRYGLSAPDDPRTLRLCNRLVAEGHLERRERRVMIPAITDAEQAKHYRACGLDPTEHEALIVTYHATR